MSLAEGSAVRISYKEYSTGAIDSNTKPVSSVDPGASGAQTLRRTSCSLNLSKDTYQASEIREDRQIADFRHGVKKVQGSINGELSPATYWDFIEALCLSTQSSAIAKTESDYTSVTADNATAKFTLGAGNPVTDGYRVGQILRFTDLSVAANNSKNFEILSFGGTNNREITVYPAPTDMSSDTAFNMTSVGKRVFMPSSAFTYRKYGVEVYHEDKSTYRLFTECRVGGINFNLPATGMATIEVAMTGRDMESGEGTDAPFFTSPTAITTSRILASVNGLVRVNGIAQGVITGAQINVTLNPSSDPVVGQDFVPDIILGRMTVTGQLTAFFEDLTLVNYFIDEDEVDILLYVTTSNADAADAMTIYLPRVKFSNAEIGLQNEQGVPITLPFQALKYEGSTAGVDQTTIAFCDTAA